MFTVFKKWCSKEVRITSVNKSIEPAHVKKVPITYVTGKSSGEAARRQSLRCLLTQYRDVEEALGKQSHSWPFSETKHAYLKDLKLHNTKVRFLMSWLNWYKREEMRW